MGETEIRVALDLGDGGETETRFLLLFSVVGEIEGPKNATLVSVFGIFETLDYRGAHVCRHPIILLRTLPRHRYTLTTFPILGELRTA